MLIKSILLVFILSIFVTADEDMNKKVTMANQGVHVLDSKDLEKISRIKYIKSYEDLNAEQKIAVQLIVKKRLHVLSLAENSNISQSKKFKESLELARKTILMNQYLQNKRDNIKVSKEEIQDYYDTHRRDFTSVHAFTLVRKDKKDLDKYLKVLAETPKMELQNTFVSLSKNYSQHPRKNKGGDMGFVGYNTIAKPFGREAFALGDNSYTLKPFKTVLGWHIVYVREKKVKSIQDLKKSIESNLISQKYREWFKSLDAQIK